MGREAHDGDVLMALKCGDCGNEETFISEAWFLHWTHIDAEGRVQQIAGRQGDSECIHEEKNAYVECGTCYSTHVLGQEEEVHDD